MRVFHLSALKYLYLAHGKLQISTKRLFYLFCMLTKNRSCRKMKFTPPKCQIKFLFSQISILSHQITSVWCPATVLALMYGPGERQNQRKTQQFVLSTSGDHSRKSKRTSYVQIHLFRSANIYGTKWYIALSTERVSISLGRAIKLGCLVILTPF